MPTPLEEIRRETAEILAAQAKARGLSVDDYLRDLLDVTGGTQDAPEMSVEDFMAAMESLAEDGVPPLPRDFSREDICFSKN